MSVKMWHAWLYREVHDSGNSLSVSVLLIQAVSVEKPQNAESRARCLKVKVNQHSCLVRFKSYLDAPTWANQPGYEENVPETNPWVKVNVSDQSSRHFSRQHTQVVPASSGNVSYLHGNTVSNMSQQKYVTYVRANLAAKRQVDQCSDNKCSPLVIPDAKRELPLCREKQ